MPRKSDNTTEARDGGNTVGVSGGLGAGGISTKEAGVSIDDHTLPKSIVTRLAKGVLPQNTSVQKDAILALSKGGTVFINYLCATANDTAKNHGRKMINPKDILEAIQMMEFDDFVPRLEAELAKFNELAAEKRAAAKKPSKSKDCVAISGSGAAKHSPSESSHNGNDSPPAPKKMRVGATTDSGTSQSKSTGHITNSVPVRGWGDEEEEEEEDIGDEEEDDIDEAEETESEALDEESDEAPEEVDGRNGQNEEDEALDNGIDSD